MAEHVCTARASCGREVAPTELTCPACLGRTRADLVAIVTLSALLPAEAEHAGVNSEAAYLAGPAAAPGLWFDRRAQVMAGSLCRCPIDACPDLTQPAGPFCLCYRGPVRLMHTSCSWILGPRCPSKRDWLSANIDDGGPAWVLGIWEMMLRDDYGMPDDRRITVASAAGFLDRVLHRVAHDPSQDFPLLAKEVHDCRAHLEAVLHDSRTPEKGAPCPECSSSDKPGPNLVKHYVDEDTTGTSDWWGCPAVEAHWWSEADYRLRVAGRFLASTDRLTADQMRDQYRIPPGTLRRWVTEGKVKRRGRDDHGRQMYDVTDALMQRDVTAEVIA